jgi:pimeloyl-ACP methyl ester carboxylesterase
MIRFFFLVLFLFFQVKIPAQNTYINKLGFTKFSIGKSKDSIDFVVSDTDFSSKKPVVVFLQGSGALPLFYFNRRDRDTFHFSSIDFPQYAQKCRFVFISKKGVAMLGEYGKNYFEKQNMTMTFLENSSLEKRSETVNNVINFLAKQRWVDDVFLVGHSEGYRVAAAVGKENNKAKKVVCMSANPFNRCLQFRMEERMNSNKGLKSDTIANKNIDSLYNFYEMLPNLEFEKNQHFEETVCKNEISYNHNFPIFDLLKIKKPILVTFGTADLGSLDNDLLPYFFYNKKKKNLTLKKYPNLDHNYLLRDENGQIQESHWNDVFQEIMLWLLEDGKK